MKQDDGKHTISLYVANKPGVLIRISLVFARRGYNIDSLSGLGFTRSSLFSHDHYGAGRHEDTEPDHPTAEQAGGERHVLATDHTDDEVIEREMALLKVRCSAEKRPEILQMAHVFNCETIDLHEEAVTFQVTGETETLDNVEHMFNPYGVVEMIRTGKVLIAPGAEATT